MDPDENTGEERNILKGLGTMFAPLIAIAALAIITIALGLLVTHVKV